MKFDTVIFDFDSTLVQIETLDYLIEIANGDHVEIRKKIKEISAKNVRLYRDFDNNSKIIEFYDSLIKRMKLAKMHRDQEKKVIDFVDTMMSEGCVDLVKELQTKGVDIYIISGGFLSLIYPTSDKLEISREKVFANEFLYNKDGYISGFDIYNPLTSYEGKIKVIEGIQKSGKNLGKIAMVGDGFSDWEVGEKMKEVVYCGYGINIVREDIKKNSQHFFTKTQDLREFLMS